MKKHRIDIRQRAKVGLRPGSIFYTGDAESKNHPLTCIAYNKSDFIEEKFDSVASFLNFREHHKDKTLWLRFFELHDAIRIQDIGNAFNINSLLLEDIANSAARPTHESHTDHDFLLFKLVMPKVEKVAVHGTIKFEIEQISMIVRNDLLITFQETDRIGFSTIIKRIQNEDSRHRTMGADYLAHSIMDSAVDHYMLALEQISDQIEEIEMGVLDDASASDRQLIHETRREIIMIRKYILPMREAVWSIYRSESSTFRDSVKPYIRDIHDHMNSVIETLEATREMVVSLSETYMSTLNLRLNEIVKLLTIISTIFIPLTFIVGIYGMNFNPDSSIYNMPELNWKWGYPAVWLAMLLITFGMIGYIKRRKWL